MEILYQIQFERNKEKKYIASRITSEENNKDRILFTYNFRKLDEIQNLQKLEKIRIEKEEEALEKLKDMKFKSQQGFYLEVSKLYNYFDQISKRNHILNKKIISSDNFYHIIYTLLSNFILTLKQQEKIIYCEEIEGIRERYINIHNKERNHIKLLTEILHYVIKIQQYKFQIELERLKNFQRRKSQLKLTFFVSKKIAIEKYSNSSNHNNNENEKPELTRISNIPQQKQSIFRKQKWARCSKKQLGDSFTKSQLINLSSTYLINKKNKRIKSKQCSLNKIQTKNKEPKIINNQQSQLKKVETQKKENNQKSKRIQLKKLSTNISKVKQKRQISPLSIIEDLDLEKYNRMNFQIKKSQKYAQKLLKDLKNRNNIISSRFDTKTHAFGYKSLEKIERTNTQHHQISN